MGGRKPGSSARMSRSRDTPRWRLRRMFAALLAPLLSVAMVVGLSVPAEAAGNAQLLVTVTAVDAATGAPITTVSATQTPRRIAFRVDFSCVTQNCDNARVAFDPMSLDPNYGAYRLLERTGFTPPLSGGNVTGSDAAGWTVNLGNLPAGASGQFALEFGWPAAAGVDIGGRVSSATQNFPDGFPITTTVRGNADTASGVIAATSAPVSWRITPPTPTTATNLAVPASGFFATDTNISYVLAMATGCGSVDRICASGYTVTHQLPPGAELVNVTGNPTVSGSVATGLVLTWTGPAWAATGPTSQGGWNPSQAVTITFPRQNVAPPGQPCDFTTQFNGPTGRVDATYISMPGTPGAVRSATLAPSGPFSLRCADPFPRAEQRGKVSTMDGSQRLENNTVSPVVIPTSGTNLKEWQVTVANTANIPGIAVVTDDTLDLQDLPVYQIVAPAGSTIAWTATNGTTTVSGTSTGTANAPTGYRFATSTVTSPVLAAPNQLPQQNNRTDFTVRYRYAVSPDATPGARRTNTASAVMNWPSNPEFAPWPLTIPPHTVELIAPFARSVFFKYADTFLTNPIGASRIMGQDIDVPVPAAGESDRIMRWNAVVANTGSAPAVPTVVDTHLGDNPEIPITQIIAGIRVGSPPPAIANGTLTQNVPFTATITLDDGTIVTYSGNNYNAPAGRRIVAATVTGPRLDGANVFPTTNASRQLEVYFQGLIPTTATRNTYTTNSFQGSLDYGVSGLGVETGSGTSTVHLVGVPPTITASLGTPSIAGGATVATPTSDVTFTVCGATANVASDHVPFTPEYVFMAPVGWNITPGSASFPAGMVPLGVSFTYRTTVVDGVTRQVAVASWPAGTTWGMNRNLPCMSVIARPDSSVTAGTFGVPRGFVGNTGDVQPADIFTRQFLDTPDIDGNPATLRFSEAAPITGVPVAAVGAMQVLKEICLPDSSRPDGCRWFSDPSNAVGVPPNSTSIRYRISVTNTGNTPLSDVVGYDVLPYPGDTGTSDATGSTPRGSTFQETVQSATTPTNGATVAFSASTQPCRPEVDATVVGCTNDWSTTASGAQAIRLTRAGTLAPGASISMRYTAAVNNAPGFGAIACNSFAVRATGLGNVSEPAPVCASIEETDLQVVAGTPRLQEGRPGVLPWTVTNNGGAPSSPAEVAVTIPAGLEVTSFTPTGWTCTAVDANGDPVFGTAAGPAVLTCTSNSPLQRAVPVALDVPVRATTTSTLQSAADVSGTMFDGNLANNHAVMSVTPTDRAGAVGVTKTDGVTVAHPGDVLTYTITVENPLDFETLTGATLTDVLPSRVIFVSASNGGTESGGVVTWALPNIPGQGTLTRTVTVRVATTINTAELVNTARVTAPDPADPTQQLTGSAVDRDQVITRPEITVDKASTTQVVTAVGQQIPYSFTVRNSGDVTLSTVSVTDAALPPSSQSNLTAVSCAATVLVPLASTTCTATYTVTQADLDHGEVVDRAVANALDPAGMPVASTPDELSIPVRQTPAVDLSKASTTTAITAAGQVVPYTFTVSNTGNVTLHGISVTDVVVAPSSPGNLSALTCPVTTLAPGQSTVCSASYTVTQTDVDHGAVADRATASGTSPAGVDVQSPTRALSIPVTFAPAIEISKTSSLGEVTRAGQQVPYTFTVRNSGNVTLTDISVADVVQAPSMQGNLTAVTCPATTLAPGAETICSATYTVTQADIDHGSVTDAATATGTPPSTAAAPDPAPVTSAPSPWTIPVTREPAIGIVKASPDLTVPIATAGQVLRYTFVVRNTGNVTLTEVTVDDQVAAPSTPANLSPITCPDVVSLAPDQTITCTATYTVTQDDVDHGSVEDTATASGKDPDGVTVTSDPSTLAIPGDPQPAIGLEKGSVLATFAAVGDVVEYTFEITNLGNVTLQDVALSDPMPGMSEPVITWPGAEGVLVPGESAHATATYTVTQADIDRGRIDNTATAVGTPPTGAPVDDDDSHRVTSTAVPHLTTTKSSTSVVSRAGDLVIYTVTVANDGAVTLEDVTIDDPLDGLSPFDYDWPGATGVLAPGQSVTATAQYRATQADVDAGQIVNTATGTGRSTTGVDLADDDTVTLVIEPQPALDLVKRGAFAPGERGEAGDTIIYTFTVENTGNVTLTGVGIVDELPGVSALQYTWPGTAGTLRPGQVATATATYVITQADVDAGLGVTNDATATGNPPVGDPVSDTDSVTLDTPADAGIQLVKTAVLDGSDPVAPGDTIRYRFEATNLGSVTLHDVTVTDPMTGLSGLVLTWPGADGVLGPRQTVVGTAEYRITQQDIDRGSVANTATTSGVTPAGVTVTDDDTATVVLPPVTRITLDKVAVIDPGEWTVGMVVTYGFTVTNRGNVTEENVRITDPLSGLSPLHMTWPGEPGVLAPGESMTATATYALTAQDIARGQLVNTATASTLRGTQAEDSVTLIAPPVIIRIGDLAVTGGQLAAGLLPVSAALVLLGAVLLVMRRRRTSRKHPAAEASR